MKSKRKTSAASMENMANKMDKKFLWPYFVEAA